MLLRQVFVWSVQVLQPFGLYYGMDRTVPFHSEGMGLSPLPRGPPEQVGEISSLLASNNGNFMAQQTDKYATVPIEQYSGFYTEVSSAGSSVLAESMGNSIDTTKTHSTMSLSWYIGLIPRMRSQK